MFDVLYDDIRIDLAAEMTPTMSNAQARLELDRRLALLLPIVIVVLAIAGIGSILIGMVQWRPAPCLGGAFVFAGAWLSQRWLRQVRIEIRRLEQRAEPA